MVNLSPNSLPYPINNPESDKTRYIEGAKKFSLLGKSEHTKATIRKLIQEWNAQVASEQNPSNVKESFDTLRFRIRELLSSEKSQAARQTIAHHAPFTRVNREAREEKKNQEKKDRDADTETGHKHTDTNSKNTDTHQQGQGQEEESSGIKARSSTQHQRLIVEDTPATAPSPTSSSSESDDDDTFVVPPPPTQTLPVSQKPDPTPASKPAPIPAAKAPSSTKTQERAGAPLNLTNRLALAGFSVNAQRLATPKRSTDDELLNQCMTEITAAIGMGIASIEDLRKPSVPSASLDMRDRCYEERAGVWEGIEQNLKTIDSQDIEALIPLMTKIQQELHTNRAIANLLIHEPTSRNKVLNIIDSKFTGAVLYTAAAIGTVALAASKYHPAFNPDMNIGQPQATQPTTSLGTAHAGNLSLSSDGGPALLALTALTLPTLATYGLFSMRTRLTSRLRETERSSSYSSSAIHLTKQLSSNLNLLAGAINEGRSKKERIQTSNFAKNDTLTLQQLNREVTQVLTAAKELVAKKAKNLSSEDAAKTQNLTDQIHNLEGLYASLQILIKTHNNERQSIISHPSLTKSRPCMSASIQGLYDSFLTSSDWTDETTFAAIKADDATWEAAQKTHDTSYAQLREIANTNRVIDEAVNEANAFLTSIPDDPFLNPSVLKQIEQNKTYNAQAKVSFGSYLTLLKNTKDRLNNLILDANQRKEMREEITTRIQDTLNDINDHEQILASIKQNQKITFTDDAKFFNEQRGALNALQKGLKDLDAKELEDLKNRTEATIQTTLTNLTIIDETATAYQEFEAEWQSKDAALKGIEADPNRKPYAHLLIALVAEIELRRRQGGQPSDTLAKNLESLKKDNETLSQSIENFNKKFDQAQVLHKAIYDDVDAIVKTFQEDLVKIQKMLGHDMAPKQQPDVPKGSPQAAAAAPSSAAKTHKIADHYAAKLHADLTAAEQLLQKQIAEVSDWKSKITPKGAKLPKHLEKLIEEKDLKEYRKNIESQVNEMKAVLRNKTGRFLDAYEHHSQMQASYAFIKTRIEEFEQQEQLLAAETLTKQLNDNAISYLQPRYFRFLNAFLPSPSHVRNFGNVANRVQATRKSTLVEQLNSPALSAKAKATLRETAIAKARKDIQECVKQTNDLKAIFENLGEERLLPRRKTQGYNKPISWLAGVESRLTAQAARFARFEASYSIPGWGIPGIWKRMVQGKLEDLTVEQLDSYIKDVEKELKEIHDTLYKTVNNVTNTTDPGLDINMLIQNHGAFKAAQAKIDQAAQTWNEQGVPSRADDVNSNRDTLVNLLRKDRKQRTNIAQIESLIPQLLTTAQSLETLAKNNEQEQYTHGQNIAAAKSKNQTPPTIEPSEVNAKRIKSLDKDRGAGKRVYERAVSQTQAMIKKGRNQILEAEKLTKELLTLQLVDPGWMDRLQKQKFNTWHKALEEACTVQDMAERDPRKQMKTWSALVDRRERGAPNALLKVLSWNDITPEEFSKEHSKVKSAYERTGNQLKAFTDHYPFKALLDAKKTLDRELDVLRGALASPTLPASHHSTLQNELEHFENILASALPLKGLEETKYWLNQFKEMTGKVTDLITEIQTQKAPTPGKWTLMRKLEIDGAAKFSDPDFSPVSYGKDRSTLIAQHKSLRAQLLYGMPPSLQSQHALAKSAAEKALSISDHDLFSDYTNPKYAHAYAEIAFSAKHYCNQELARLQRVSGITYNTEDEMAQTVGNTVSQMLPAEKEKDPNLIVFATIALCCEMYNLQLDGVTKIPDLGNDIESMFRIIAAAVRAAMTHRAGMTHHPISSPAQQELIHSSAAFGVAWLAATHYAKIPDYTAEAIAQRAADIASTSLTDVRLLSTGSKHKLPDAFKDGVISTIAGRVATMQLLKQKTRDMMSDAGRRAAEVDGPDPVPAAASPAPRIILGAHVPVILNIQEAIDDVKTKTTAVEQAKQKIKFTHQAAQALKNLVKGAQAIQAQCAQEEELAQNKENEALKAATAAQISLTKQILQQAALSAKTLAEAIAAEAPPISKGGDFDLCSIAAQATHLAKRLSNILEDKNIDRMQAAYMLQKDTVELTKRMENEIKTENRNIETFLGEVKKSTEKLTATAQSKINAIVHPPVAQPSPVVAGALPGSPENFAAQLDQILKVSGKLNQQECNALKAELEEMIKSTVIDTRSLCLSAFPRIPRPEFFLEYVRIQVLATIQATVQAHPISTELSLYLRVKNEALKAAKKAAADAVTQKLQEINQDQIDADPGANELTDEMWDAALDANTAVINQYNAIAQQVNWLQVKQDKAKKGLSATLKQAVDLAHPPELDIWKQNWRQEAVNAAMHSVFQALIPIITREVSRLARAAGGHPPPLADDMLIDHILEEAKRAAYPAARQVVKTRLLDEYLPRAFLEEFPPEVKEFPPEVKAQGDALVDTLGQKGLSHAEQAQTQAHVFHVAEKAARLNTEAIEGLRATLSPTLQGRFGTLYQDTHKNVLSTVITALNTELVKMQGNITPDNLKQLEELAVVTALDAAEDFVRPQVKSAAAAANLPIPGGLFRGPRAPRLTPADEALSALATAHEAEKAYREIWKACKETEQSILSTTPAFVDAQKVVSIADFEEIMDAAANAASAAIIKEKGWRNTKGVQEDASKYGALAAATSAVIYMREHDEMIEKQGGKKPLKSSNVIIATKAATIAVQLAKKIDHSFYVPSYRAVYDAAVQGIETFTKSLEGAKPLPEQIMDAALEAAMTRAEPLVQHQILPASIMGSLETMITHLNAYLNMIDELIPQPPAAGAVAAAGPVDLAAEDKKKNLQTLRTTIQQAADDLKGYQDEFKLPGHVQKTSVQDLISSKQLTDYVSACVKKCNEIHDMINDNLRTINGNRPSDDPLLKTIEWPRTLKWNLVA